MCILKKLKRSTGRHRKPKRQKVILSDPKRKETKAERERRRKTNEALAHEQDKDWNPNGKKDI